MPSSIVKKLVSNYTTIEEVKVKEIEIEPFSHPFAISGRRQEKLREDVFFAHSKNSLPQKKEQVYNDIAAILEVLRDPFQVAQHLKNLDQALGLSLKINKCKIGNILPKFIIEGCSSYLPGPPPDEYIPYQKKKALEKLLLKRERKDGINTEGNAKFVGSVPTKEANEFLKNNLFGEDEQVGRMLLHGKYSHRLVFEIIRVMIEKNEITSFADSKEVLNFFITDIDGSGNNLWNLIMDTVFDSNLEPFCFSSSSPFVLKSLITCFGSDLGLENLQKYLLDSHYKQVAQMWARSSTFETEKFEEFYKRCSFEMSNVKECDLVALPENPDYLLLPQNAASDKKYQPHPQTPNSNSIKLKVSMDQNPEKPPYNSLQEYVARKFGKLGAQQ